MFPVLGRTGLAQQAARQSGCPEARAGWRHRIGLGLRFECMGRGRGLGISCKYGDGSRPGRPPARGSHRQRPGAYVGMYVYTSTCRWCWPKVWERTLYFHGQCNVPAHAGRGSSQSELPKRSLPSACRHSARTRSFPCCPPSD